MWCGSKRPIAAGISVRCSHLLPLIREEGYEAVCHLHTKKGDSGYAAEWRAIAYDGLIRDNDLVTRLLGGVRRAIPTLMLAGPAALYKSAASHQFGNAAILSDLAPRLMAPLYPLADWGFFAGTFFWARPALLERLAAPGRIRRPRCRSRRHARAMRSSG